MEPISPGFAGLTAVFGMEKPVTSKAAGSRLTDNAVTAFSLIVTVAVYGVYPNDFTMTSCDPARTCWMPAGISRPSTVTMTSAGVEVICRNPMISESDVW